MGIVTSCSGGGSKSSKSTAGTSGNSSNEETTIPASSTSGSVDLSSFSASASNVTVANQSSYTISGSCNDEISTVTITNIDYSLDFDASCSSGSFSTNLDLSSITTDGTYTFTITQEGSSSTASEDVSITVIKQVCSDGTKAGYTAQFAQGDGTSGDPYIICSAAQYVLLETLYSDGDYVELGNDIDFGSSTAANFNLDSGNFDGKDFTLSNIVNPVNAELFGTMNGSGVLKNLKIDNITGSFSASANALLVGQMSSSSSVDNITIKNGTYTMDAGVSTRITMVSAVVSNLIGASSITNIDSDIDINAYNGNLGATAQRLGGITGDFTSSGSATNLINRGNIQIGNTGATATVSSCGGVINWVSGSTTNINTFSNYGNITVYNADGSCGGIVGEINNIGEGITLSKFKNYGDVTVSESGTCFIAGVIGTTNETDLIVEEFLNEGAITSTNNVGGLIANFNRTGIIRSSYNSGDIYSTTNKAGGIIARGNTATTIAMENVYNKGNVTTVSGDATGFDSGIPNHTLTVSTSFSYSSIDEAGSNGQAIGYDASNFNSCTNCYYNNELDANSSVGVGLTSAQMTDLSNFTGFSGTEWKIDTTISTEHPVLIWQ